MRKVHFMGIGGSGMNAVAGIAHWLGYDVSGCDLKESEYLGDLVALHIPIEYGHSAAHLHGCDLLCVSPAVFDLNQNHEEIAYARVHSIPVMTWQQFMGEYLQKHSKVIAIAGTKGKTTTTSLCGYLLERADFDPVVASGGVVKNWGKNYRCGSGSYFVCEADEFNHNFLHYHPLIAVITNISFDHPEFFSSYSAYLGAFVSFVGNVHDGGTLILNTDSAGCLDLLGRFSSALKRRIRVIGYGFHIPNPVMSDFFSDFFLIDSLSDNRSLLSFRSIFSASDSVELRSVQKVIAPFLLGSHNVMNTVAALLAVKTVYGRFDSFLSALSAFEGVGRRFELVCEARGIKIYYDYAHNPMSVAAVLSLTRDLFPDARIWALFQPHLYSRTRMFLDDFALAFAKADQIVITDIYPAREEGSPLASEIHSNDLVVRIQQLNPSCRCRYIGRVSDVAPVILPELQSGDVLVNMGAGDNGIISQELCRNLRS